MHLSS